MPDYSRFTDRACKVMQLAQQEAQRLNHGYVGTEHVLLGLVKEGSGVAANVLKNLDIDLRKIRIETEKLVQPGPEMVSMGKLPLTPNVVKVAEHAIEESASLGHTYQGTEHLLLGLLCNPETTAYKVLVALGVSARQVRDEVLSILGTGSLDEEESPDWKVQAESLKQEIISEVFTNLLPGGIESLTKMQAAIAEIGRILDRNLEPALTVGWIKKVLEGLK